MRVFWIVLVLAGCDNNNLPGGGAVDMAIAGPAPGTYGAPCSANSDCNSQVCSPEGRCSDACTSDSQCQLGWRCLPLTGGATACQCPLPQQEMCNGADDDCDGIIDDGATCPTGLSCVKASCQCIAPNGSVHAKLVADQITVPMDESQFAADLNGDGRPDNQYGNVLAALGAAGGTDPQTDVDSMVASGQLLLLLDVKSNDATFTTDVCAGARLANAMPQVAPDFTGHGSFTVDSSTMPGDFTGPIAGKDFSSLTDSLITAPVTMKLYLPLLATGAPVLVPLTGGQLTFSLATGKGQVNGAIRKDDLVVLEDNIAQSFNATVQADPTSPSSQQVLSIFDDGGSASSSTACGTACTNPDGTCGVKSDGVIQTCEVTSNSIVRNVLALDVQLFDAAGNWAPNPANTMKDSFSLGFGFHAVGASF